MILLLPGAGCMKLSIAGTVLTLREIFYGWPMEGLKHILVGTEGMPSSLLVERNCHCLTVSLITYSTDTYECLVSPSITTLLISTNCYGYRESGPFWSTIENGLKSRHKS